MYVHVLGLIINILWQLTSLRSRWIPITLRYLFQVQMDVSVWFTQDQLKGDNITELRLKFNKRLEDAIPAGEDWGNEQIDTKRMTIPLDLNGQGTC